MNFYRLEQRIMKDEGFRADPYQDTLSVWTIGYGTTRWNGEPVTEETPPMSPSEGQIHLRADLYEALILCQRIYNNFDCLDSVRQEVLVNMAYNLGSRLKKFKRMNAAVQAYDFATWALEMEDSRWWHQVGDRAKRLRKAVVNGTWT